MSDTPTPIDPADIRPGDVVEQTVRIEVAEVVSPVTFWGRPLPHRTDTRFTPTRFDFRFGPVHLVSRPDPDAEAVEALLAAGLTDDANLIESDTARIARRYLANLRERGWDVVRRADHPVTVLAEPEPEWVEGAWYWVNHRAVMENRVMRRVTRGWSISSSHDLADYSDSEVTVLGRVLIVEWPGDDVAEAIEADNPPRTDPTDMTAGDYAAQIIADAIRTQGGAR